MGPKWGLLCPFLGGAESPSNTMLPGPRPTSAPSGILIHPAIWPQETWAKNWGLCLFGWSWVSMYHNTMWPRLRPTSTPSGILIHPTVWPQYSNVTDRQNRQTGQTWQTDNGPIACGEPFYTLSPKNVPAFYKIATFSFHLTCLFSMFAQ